MYEMGLTAAREGCRGAVPSKPDSRPTEACFALLSHIPTDQGAVARTGRRALVWKTESRKTHLYGFG